MVQALRELLEDEYCDEASLTEALSMFECAHMGEEAQDVIWFLRKLAIPFEKDGTARTYLVVNDAAAERGRLQIDGYFSVAIKVLYFHDVDSEVLRQAFGDSSKKNCPAFLIGQLARGTYSPKGAGIEYLNIALSYIAEASNIVGGRFVYLDCVPERQSYYEKCGFTFLQQKHKSNLIQMYRVI